MFSHKIVKFLKFNFVECLFQIVFAYLVKSMDSMCDCFQRFTCGFLTFSEKCGTSELESVF